MHKNRTANGLRLQEQHNQRYKKMLIGKKAKDGRTVINTEWIGNSTYGCVRLFFDNQTDDLCSSTMGFKPTREDFTDRYGITW